MCFQKPDELTDESKPFPEKKSNQTEETIQMSSVRRFGITQSSATNDCSQFRHFSSREGPRSSRLCSYIFTVRAELMLRPRFEYNVILSPQMILWERERHTREPGLSFNFSIEPAQVVVHLIIIRARPLTIIA
jgi:hypothetical protein